MNENDLIPKKRAMMGLLMAGENNRDGTLGGYKTITIREGWRDYHTNDKVLIGSTELNWCVVAKITSVNFYMLKDVPIKDIVADGFADHEDALLNLQAYYQNLTEDSPVTVIRFQITND
jgi:hypothetical protein